MVSVSSFKHTSLIEFLYKKSFSTTAFLKASDKDSNTTNQAQPDSSNREDSQQESSNNQHQPADGQPEASNATGQQTTNQPADFYTVEGQHRYMMSLVDELRDVKREIVDTIDAQDRLMRDIPNAWTDPSTVSRHAQERASFAENGLSILEERIEILAARQEELADKIYRIDSTAVPRSPEREGLSVYYNDNRVDTPERTLSNSPENAPDLYSNTEDNNNQPEASERSDVNNGSGDNQAEASGKRKRSDDDNGSGDNQAEVSKRKKISDGCDDHNQPEVSAKGKEKAHYPFEGEGESSADISSNPIGPANAAGNPANEYQDNIPHPSTDDASHDQPETLGKRKRSDDDNGGFGDDQPETSKSRKLSTDNNDDNNDNQPEASGKGKEKAHYSSSDEGESSKDKAKSAKDKKDSSNDDGSDGDGGSSGGAGPSSGGDDTSGSSGETGQAGPSGEANSF